LKPFEGGVLSYIWCIRKGKDRGFKNDLVACVACHCRQRKRCRAYAEAPFKMIVAANVEAGKNGHSVVESFPLFESAHRR
jgi:hypothetical protein